MKNMKNNNQPNLPKMPVRIVDVEAEAYYGGTQNVPIENSLAETDAEFEAVKERVHRETVANVKRLEGEQAVAVHRRAEAEGRWQMWQDKTGGVRPLYLVYLLFVFAGFGAMTGETLLLQPLMDIFGVADDAFKYAMAGLIVLVLALAIELPLFLWRSNYRIAAYATGAVVLLSLIALGVYRAYALEFIEAGGDSTLAGLFSATPILNKYVMSFLTTVLPVGATFAFEIGWHGMNVRRQWSKARKDALRFAKLDETKQKELESAEEQRDRMIAELDAERDRWQAAQRQAHDEGVQMKARRQPFWQVLLLLLGGCFLILAVVMLLAYIFFDAALTDAISSDAGRFVLYLTCAGGLMSIFAFIILKRWHSPTPTQLYAQRTVVWHDAQEAEEPRRIESKDENLPRRIVEAAENAASNNGKYAHHRLGDNNYQNAMTAKDALKYADTA